MSHDYFGVSFMPLALSKLEIFNIAWTYPPLGAQGFLFGYDTNTFCYHYTLHFSVKYGWFYRFFGI